MSIMRGHTMSATLLIVLAGLMGAAGVVLAAVGAHRGAAGTLPSAAYMLLFHAPVILAAVLLHERGLVQPQLALMAAIGFVVGAGLFAADVTLRELAGQRLFPMAAPSGGVVLIASWLALALSALLASRTG
jgi:uncharacterized membrane protein YgdD (TMEM256/DUF423 family)